MRDSGRLAGAIEVLTAHETGHVPLKTCVTDWGRAHRFAGSGDRSWISSLVHDAVRSRRSLSYLMQDDSPRAACLGALRHGWNWTAEAIAAAAAEEPHGPGPLTDTEQACLSTPPDINQAADEIAGDMPDWLAAGLAARGFDLRTEGAAFARRAPIDLRVNTLKCSTEKAGTALARAGPQQAEYVVSALRVPPPRGHERAPALEAMPAYAKGWVEVQDLGSQLVSLAAGDIKGRQVLDLCAGAGGKTLALAALAGNTGQVFAYDIDARRLVPIFDRLKRAGVRNVQVRSPAENASLHDLAGNMDQVFVDAPCSGSGTWRRKPDAKWRLTEKQLQARMSQQDEVLDQAAGFVRPGGQVVYVTCSFLAQENRDRIAAFLARHPEFGETDSVAPMADSGQLREGAEAALRTHQQPEGSLQLTPARSGTDGFFVATLKRKG